jgi:hypothetical protein
VEQLSGHGTVERTRNVIDDSEEKKMKRRRREGGGAGLI